MSFERAFQLSTLLLLLTGFAANLVAEGVGSITAVLYLGALAVCWVIAPVPTASWQQWLAVLFACALFAGDTFLLSSLAEASVRLLLVLSLLKVLTRRSDRDYLQIYLSSLALLLVAATFRPSISYLVISIGFLFLSILTLILFENRRGYQKNAAAEFSLAANCIAALAMTVLILLLAIPIFFAIPRGEAGFWDAGGGNVTGFSESVRLGALGQVLNNQQVVMRVKVNWPVDTLPEHIKWRGIVLDYFDGAVWKNQSKRSQRVRRDPEGRFLLERNRRHNERLLEQVFLVEPFSKVVFAAPDVIQISGLGAVQSLVFQDGNDSVSLKPKPRKPFRYYVHSDLQTRQQRLQGESDHLSQLGDDRYVQLPLIDKRILLLAREITRTAESPVEQALQIEDYLRSNLEYTLENPSAEASDPLANFLFESRAGHCEYFAAAQAVMLRELRIPARVVNGFRRGEYNEWGDYFIVRASDAHSWVEAYFPGKGWIEFDPTPQAVPEATFGWIGAFGRIMDSVEVLWGEIVTFDRSKQAGFFQLVRAKIEQSWAATSGRCRGLLQMGTAGGRSVLESIWSLRVEFVVGILTLVVLYRYRRFLKELWKRKGKPRDETELARDYYLEMLDLLREKGFVKSRFETPAEFARRVSHQVGSDLPLKITDSYYQTRFGGILLDSRQLSNIHWLLRELEDTFNC